MSDHATVWRARASSVLAPFREDWWLRLLAGLVALLGLLYLRRTFLGGINSDEVEHAHIGFRILIGQLPYRDFVQNHWPAYWLLTTRLVQAFPFSVNAILAGRVVSLLALAGSWFLGLRLLAQVPGGRTRLAILIYTFAVMTTAPEVQFHVARPDPLMVLLGTAGLCLVPVRGPIRSGRAGLLGLLFGLAASVSTKVAPFALVVPMVVLIRAAHERSLAPLRAVAAYGFGALVGLLPTVVWLVRGGHLRAFYFDVFELNAALSKPWYQSFDVVLTPIFLAALVGALAWLTAGGHPLNGDRNGPLVLVLALASGIVLAFLTRHNDSYHFQLLVIPWAVGFTCLFMVLRLRTSTLAVRLCTVAALIVYPAALTTTRLLPLGDGSISQSDLQQLIDLARPGELSCMAFSPVHPVFCRDVSEVANGWDAIFVELVSDERQLARFRRVWRDAIRSTLDGEANIIVRHDSWDVWGRAAESGLVSSDELALLDELGRSYEVKLIGDVEVWVRPPRN